MKTFCTHLLAFLLVGSVCLNAQSFLKDFRSIEEFVTFNGESYFIGEDSEHGIELWKTDGTKMGTSLVKDIYPGIDGSQPQNLFIHNSILYFSANDGIHGPIKNGLNLFSIY
ncbi:MAG: ELWxxDGT repeat protein [Bacteroidota bacterium]